MSTILFPGYRTEQPTNPWMCTLCSQCGHLDRSDLGAEASEREHCDCIPDNPDAAVILLLVVDEDQIRQQLTGAGVGGHVVARVLRIMNGEMSGDDVG